MPYFTSDGCHSGSVFVNISTRFSVFRLPLFLLYIKSPCLTLQKECQTWASGGSQTIASLRPLYDCLVVVGDLPGATHPPVGILRPAEVTVVNTAEDILIAVVGDGNLVGLIGLQIQLDGAVAPGLREGV